MRLGIILVLSVIGLLTLIFKKNRDAVQDYIVGLSFLFIPIISHGMYVYQTLYVLFVVISALALEEILQLLKNPTHQSAVITSLLLLILIFTFFTDGYHKNYSTEKT